MARLYAWSSIATHDAGWDMGFHQHQSLEVAVIIEGSGLFETDKIHEFRPGDAIFIPADIPHRFMAYTPFRLCVFMIDNIDPDVVNLFSSFVKHGKVEIFQLSMLEMEQYHMLFKQWLRTLSDNLVNRGAHINTWLKLLLLFLEQNLHKSVFVNRNVYHLAN